MKISAASTASRAAKSRKTAIPSEATRGAHPHSVAPIEQGHVAQLADPRRQQVHEHVADSGHEGEREQPGNQRFAAAAQQDPIAPGAQQGLGDLREQIRADQGQLGRRAGVGEPRAAGSRVRLGRDAVEQRDERG